MEGYGAAYCEMFMRGHNGCCFLATEMAKERREENAIRKHTQRSVVDVLIAIVSGGGGLLVGIPPFSGVCSVVCIVRDKITPLCSVKQPV